MLTIWYRVATESVTNKDLKQHLPEFYKFLSLSLQKQWKAL